MIRGRAHRVCVRLPPPSCRSTIDRGRTSRRTLAAISSQPGLVQSTESTSQVTVRIMRSAATRRTFGLTAPYGGRKIRGRFPVRRAMRRIVLTSWWRIAPAGSPVRSSWNHEWFAISWPWRDARFTTRSQPSIRLPTQKKVDRTCLRWRMRSILGV